MVKRAINPLPVMKNNDAIDPLKDLEIEEKKNDTQAAEPELAEPRSEEANEETTKRSS